jgi:predicted transcriptional regulator
MTFARDVSPLRRRREELGLQVSEVARLINRSAALISNCEGGFVPDHGRRKQIAAALETTPEVLWPEEYR